MKSRRLLLAGFVVSLGLAAAVIALAPARQSGGHTAHGARIDDAEQAQTIAAMKPPKRPRPVIAIVASNEATEITDFLVPYGVLQRSGIADVTVVAASRDAVPLHPFSRVSRGPELLRVDPQETFQDFDARYPDGADYVVVPAIEPRDDARVVPWIAAQHGKGATIISVCAGALTLANAGLLDGRRATTHWAYVDDLRRSHPSMRWVADRRYVADDRVVTSTGITASIPTALALVEAISGQEKAQQVAHDLGVKDWDARHQSSAFQLSWDDRKTFLRNWLSFWRHDTVGLPVQDGVDEISLALVADGFSRTAFSTVLTVGNGKAIVSRHGLTLHPASANGDSVDIMLPPPAATVPARAIETVLSQIEKRYDRPTAEIVALVVEYPWPNVVSNGRR